jgi:hypothetical protein
MFKQGWNDGGLNSQSYTLPLYMNSVLIQILPSYE